MPPKSNMLDFPTITPDEPHFDMQRVAKFLKGIITAEHSATFHQAYHVEPSDKLQLRQVAIDLRRNVAAKVHRLRLKKISELRHETARPAVAAAPTEGMLSKLTRQAAVVSRTPMSVDELIVDSLQKLPPCIGRKIPTCTTGSVPRDKDIRPVPSASFPTIGVNRERRQEFIAKHCRPTAPPIVSVTTASAICSHQNHPRNKKQ